MSKYIAIQDCKFSFSVGSGKVNVTSSTSKNVKIKSNDVIPINKGAYFGTLSFDVKNFGGVVITNKDGTGMGNIIPPIRKVQEKGENVILQGDSAIVTLTGHAGKETVQEIVTVTISDAGQDIVKGE